MLKTSMGLGRSCVALGFIALTWVSVRAEAAQAPVEVVTSVPIETSLSVPGIKSTQQAWLEMIGAAKNSIDIEEFYITSKAGEAMEPVLNALMSAAGRGVQIRILVDSKFFKTYPSDPTTLNQISGIQVRTIDFSPYDGVQHSKYFIVDQSEAYVGSANFDWLALSHIHEVGLRIADGQIGADLESVFYRDWAAGVPIAGAAKPVMDTLSLDRSALPGLSGYRVVASPPRANPPGMPDTLSAITQLMGTAHSSLKIQMYEYTTSVYHSSKRWTDLDSAIRKAAAGGVKVQLLVDEVALKAGRAELRALSGLANVQVRTVTIPQWSGGAIPYARLIHSKYFVVDGAAGWVGSENWCEGYFSDSRNVGVILQSAEIAGGLGQVFDQVWGSSYTSKLVP